MTDANLVLLTQLATAGFSVVSANRLGEISDSCNHHCRETGDGRYCILGQTFEQLHEWWSEHDKYNGIPIALARQIERLILDKLGPIVGESDLATAADLAATFEGGIVHLLLPENFWSSSNGSES